MQSHYASSVRKKGDQEPQHKASKQGLPSLELLLDINALLDLWTYQDSAD